MSRLKLVHIVGARPQFIKSSAVSRVIKNNEKFSNIDERYIHTGQHYDKNMSGNFFEELEIPEPNYNLGVGSETHGKQTALMLERIEKVLIKEKPDWVLIYGDTNSTLAAAVAAAKLHLRVGHIEAGLRNNNRKMPEEINRIVADKVSDVLFAPTENAMNNLMREGLGERLVLVGDVMYDSLLFYKDLADQRISKKFKSRFSGFYLATIHRAENTDDLQRLQSIFTALSMLDAPVVIPLHPRTQKIISRIDYNHNVKIIEPASYLEIIYLLKTCKKVLTDSGGLQKEAFILNKPCITLMEETAWVETLENNWNFTVGANTDEILKKIRCNTFGEKGNHFGDGHSCEKIIEFILDFNSDESENF